MNYAYLKHELLLMIKSKKNLMFLLFLTALLVSYCFVILPEQKTIDSFDSKAMETSLVELKALQEGREKRGATGYIGMAGMSVYALDEFHYSTRSAMLNAYEKEAYTRFLRLRYFDRGPQDFINDENLFPNSPFPVKDRTHVYEKMQKRYKSYLTGDLPVSMEIIEQKTALQTLQNLLLNASIYLFVFCAIYFSSDILVRDRRNRTVLEGMPIGWYRLLNLKTVAAFTYTGVVLSVLGLIGMAILTFTNGLGFTDLQIAHAVEGEIPGFMNYEMMTIGKFIALTLAGVILLIYLFTRLSMVLSLLFKNEWLVLLIASFILFAERLYFERDLREIMGIDISYFPQTYFEIGQVLTGEKNFLVNLTSISYSKGMLLFVGTIVFVEIILWILSKIINKQRFYGFN